MEQSYRFYSFLVACLLTVGTWAQTWTASAVGEGTFYLYSVSEGKFLAAGTTYGTRASLTAQGGIPLTLTAVDAENGVYSISSAPTFTGRIMGIGSDGNEAYFDVQSTSSSQATNWKFIAVEGQANTYFIQAVKNSKYMVAHASKLDRTSVTSTTQPTTSKGYWKLVAKDDLIANLSNAAEDHPIDATFMVLNHSFSMSSVAKTHWTGDCTAWGGTDNNKCVEQFNRTYDMYQTITDVPNGVYTMTCQGYYRMGDIDPAVSARNAGTESLNAKYYMNDVEGSLKSIFDYSRGATYNTTYNSSTKYTVEGKTVYVPSNLNRASECLNTTDDYWNEPIRVVVTDGTINLGFRKTVTVTNDWAAYDNVVLTYYGVDLSILQESYETQLAAAKALQDEPMNTTVKANLNAAVTAAETNVNTSSESWLTETCSQLNAAVTAARTSNERYTGEILNTVNGIKAQSTSESVKSAIQTKYDNGDYATAADVYAAYQPLELAAIGTEPAAGTTFTSVIINPSFELGNLDGWNIQTRGNDTGVFSTSNATYAYSDTDGDYLFNTWASNVKTLDIQQTITGLPTGYYTLSAVVATFGDGASIIMNANGATAYVTPTSSNADAEKGVGHELTLENILVTDGTLTFSLQNTGKKQTLLKADDFQLTYTAPYVAPTVFTELSFNLNVENSEVAGFLANTTYDESTATVINNYATAAVLRNDQPATVSVPLPQQNEDATLSLALNSTYTGAETFTVAAGSVTYEIKNLLPNETYYYKIEAGGNVIANGTIATTGQLRMIKADGIANMRDLGGWVNADGNSIRYGKIYRGSELREGHTYTASDADLQMLANLDIQAEVDLREDKDFASGLMNSSAINNATYYYANLYRWSEDALNRDAAKFKNGFDLMLAALKDGHAAYFHCIFGADRTGCFAFLIEGLLGLPVDQLYKDYELTSFSSAGLREKTGIDHKLQYIKALQGTTLQEKFYNYWRGAVGVSESDLNDFINIMIDGTSPITTAELADLPTKAVEDGEYYIYLPSLEKFMGRGEAYGARALADNYGVPAEITTNGANVTTIKYLDSNLYLGSDCFTDKAVGYNTVSWFIEHRGDDLVMRSHNGYYVGLTSENGLYKPRADIANVANAMPITFKTLAEQKTIVAATQQTNILAAAAAAGITAADLPDFNAQLSTNYTAVPSTASIKSATIGSKTDWTLAAVAGNTYNVGSYGGELYQTTGTVSQTVTVSHAGLYKLTLNALFRQGSNATCYGLGQKGYELSNAYVSINDEFFTQIPSWYSDAASNSNPDNTTQAQALMDAGKYAIEVYAYIGDTKTATIKIHVPGYTSACWCLFNNFAFTEYAKKMTIRETDTGAPTPCDFAEVTLGRTLVGEQWNGFSLPFSLTQEQLEASPLNGAAIMEYASANDNELSFAYTHTIVAGNPYLIKPESTIENPVFTGVAVTNPDEAVKGDGDYIFAAHLYNTPLATNGSVAYVSTTDSSIKMLTSGGIKGLRSYFQIPASSQVKALVLKFEDTDDITEMENVQRSASIIYNLAGQRLQQPQRGVNIVGGKKVIIK